mgnify:CR=1 FL=1
MKRWFLTGMVAAAALVFTACGNSSSTTAAQESTLDKVLANKKLRVAIIPDNPGWSTLGTDNSYTGVDADVARLLADSLGVEVEFENTDGAGRVSMIESDKADVVIACLTATNERARQVAFSDPYAASGILGLCKSDNVFTSWDDLKDKKIAVPRGSTNDIFATAAYPDAEIVRFDAIADAFTALQTGKVDVLLEEDTTVNDLAAKNADMAVMPVEQQRSSYIAMASKRGDEIWLEYLNNFIRNALYSGDLNEIYKTHFNKDMPSLLTY